MESYLWSLFIRWLENATESFNFAYEKIKFRVNIHNRSKSGSSQVSYSVEILLIVLLFLAVNVECIYTYKLMLLLWIQSHFHKIESIVERLNQKECLCEPSGEIILFFYIPLLCPSMSTCPEWDTGQVCEVNIYLLNILCPSTDLMQKLFKTGREDRSVRQGAQAHAAEPAGTWLLTWWKGCRLAAGGRWLMEHIDEEPHPGRKTQEEGLPSAQTRFHVYIKAGCYW